MSADLGNRNTMQASWPTLYYNKYYTECAEYPCQPKFRRFGSQWIKKLDDDVEELRRRENELNKDIAKMWRSDCNDPYERTPTFLDCPRRFIERSDDSVLLDKWRSLEDLRRTFSQSD